MATTRPIYSPSEALEPRLLFALANGVDPANLGKGEWIWRMSAAQEILHRDTQQVLDFLKSQGVQWIAVKCGDGGSIWSQFNADLVNRAHNTGLKIFGWAYAYGANVAGEVNVARNALALGADGFIIDAEGEYERLANNAAAADQYCRGIRQAYPNHFLGHSPFPIISYHSRFPYVTMGKWCDAVMPQAYWATIGVTPEYMVEWMGREWRTAQANWTAQGNGDAVKPIAPLGQAYHPGTGPEITRFVNALKADPNPPTAGGYKAVSFWSVQHHSAEHWEAVGPARIGNRPGALSAPSPADGTSVAAAPAVLDWADTPAANEYDVYLDGTKRATVTRSRWTIAGGLSNGGHTWQVVAKNPNGSRNGPTWRFSLGPPARVVGRHVFYNNSAFDNRNPAANAADNGAIATDKRALLPGQTASFANYTSFDKGLNGIMVDIAGLSAAPTAGAFDFKVGNDNAVGGWLAAPALVAVSRRIGGGSGGGSDRVTVVWPDGAIKGKWLRVTVKAGAGAGLLNDDVFYFGNAPGESGNSGADAVVNYADEAGARSHAGAGVPVTNRWDYNRDRTVNAEDQLVARRGRTTSSAALRLIAAPNVAVFSVRPITPRQAWQELDTAAPVVN